MNQFQQDRVSFNYPEEWEILQEQADGQNTITVSPDEVSFWSLTVFDEPVDLQFIIDQALETFQEEYDSVDVYEVESSLCDSPNLSLDVEFICVELVNGAFLRAIDCGTVQALVYYQATDYELKRLKPIFEAISLSLSLTGS